MTTSSAAREQARQGDGKFGVQQRSEADGIDLTVRPSAQERATRREQNRAARAEAEARRDRHTYADGTRFTCETHDEPGSCDSECLDLAVSMAADEATVVTEDRTGVTYIPSDYDVPESLHLDTERGAVIWTPARSADED